MDDQQCFQLASTHTCNPQSLVPSPRKKHRLRLPDCAERYRTYSNEAYKFRNYLMSQCEETHGVVGVEHCDLIALATEAHRSYLIASKILVESDEKLDHVERLQYMDRVVKYAKERSAAVRLLGLSSKSESRDTLPCFDGTPSERPPTTQQPTPRLDAPAGLLTAKDANAELGDK